jgi:hypothetical protein
LNYYNVFGIIPVNSMPIYPLQRVFYPQNRPCTPQIVGTFYMQGYKVKEKTAIVPHCTPSFKTHWAPCVKWVVVGEYGLIREGLLYLEKTGFLDIVEPHYFKFNRLESFT